ncbi:MAG TPA: TonB family protein, partial [Thermoanaerobaculia bacterium]|nr:TonB family protein [Thermoanaerobaculia bacterium]
AATREEVALIHTSKGDIVFRFFPTAAPQHVSYVKELIGRGFYDGTTFHRVIPHFVIQGGDPNSKDADRSNDGDGEADHRVKAEFSAKLHYRPGTVGMARDADPDSGSCQFFIALENIPRLDGKYTIFGEVVSGLEVARAIAGLPRDLKDNPLEAVPMTVRLKTMRVPPKMVSLGDGPDGEVLTGPGKPKPYDPGDLRWKAPRLQGAGAAGDPSPGASPGRLDLSIDENGSVLDVRFADLDFPEAARRQAEVMQQWRFTPALLEGNPVKARFSVDAQGGDLRSSAVPGTPLDLGAGDLTPPGSLVRVDIPAGMMTPPKEPLLRLTIDQDGRVADVSVQVSCGDRALDETAAGAAKALSFVPARKGKEAVSVYLNVAVKWNNPSAP